MEKWKPSYAAGGNVNGVADLEKSLALLQKFKIFVGASGSSVPGEVWEHCSQES